MNSMGRSFPKPFVHVFRLSDFQHMHDSFHSPFINWTRQNANSSLYLRADPSSHSIVPLFKIPFPPAYDSGSDDTGKVLFVIIKVVCLMLELRESKLNDKGWKGWRKIPLVKVN